MTTARNAKTDEVASMAGRDTRGGRIPELDAIRGLAILLVLVHHYLTADHAAVTGVKGFILQRVSFGWAGVDLFFVLSGFLIGGIILRNGHRDGFLLGFYRRRAARLLPLYLVVLGLFVIAGPLLIATQTREAVWLTGGRGLPTWSYLLYLQNFAIAAHQSWGGHWMAPTWSLAVEEQFYLIAPLLILCVPTRYLLAVLVAMIAVSPVFRSVMYAKSGGWIPSYVLLPGRWDALAFGVLGAYALERPDWRAWLHANPVTIWRIFQVLGVFHLIVLLAGYLDHTGWYMASIGFTLLAAFALSFVAVSLLVPNAITRALTDSKRLMHLGVISYGVYLLHQPILGLTAFVWDSSNGMLVPTIIAAVVTIVVAHVSWRYFEQPILDASVSPGSGAPACARA